jgi:hypothetical protein
MGKKGPNDRPTERDISTVEDLRMFILPRPVACSPNGGAFWRGGLALLLVVALASAATAPAFAKAPRASDPDIMKQKVEKLGVGEHVAVKRVAGKTLHGHITAIGEQSFRLHADKATSETEIAYNEVRNVKKNPGALGWMLVGAAIVIVIIVATR